ncbi:MAG TPA: tRNA (adenosine(37)-N6)-threonylcarbamoyltransferase complex dimerization subunit type 1 TsaB [Terriglobia bacterium]|nr:tRNA (adenosine(37)-N6)-threonylcarbamoyltransferase complex dimerization subunit type 1 TsaB [Terriglobia bacterium]
MLILAFDTTSEHGGVSLHRDFECLASAESHGEANYSVTLFQMVAGLLSGTKLALHDVDLIAVATGPGSFTGIRVGLAAAQGWGQAIERPVCGVSVLEAMAELARPGADWAVPILDARRGEFYLSFVRRQNAERARAGEAGGGDALQGAEQADRPPDGVPQPGLLLNRESVRTLLERFANGRSAGEMVCCVAREWDSAARGLRVALQPEFNWQIVEGSLTGAIARLALIAHREGRAQTPSQLDALYLRRSDAEMHWEEN